MKKYRVVFHLDDNDEARINLVLGNIRNLLSEFGEDVAIAMVAHSGGIVCLLRGPNIFRSQVEELAGKGVRLLACSNSLCQKGLGRDALLESVEVVPSGVADLVKRQAEGWIYIRP